MTDKILVVSRKKVANTPFPHSIKFLCREDPLMETRELAINTWFFTWSFLTKLTRTIQAVSLIALLRCSILEHQITAHTNSTKKQTFTLMENQVTEYIWDNCTSVRGRGEGEQEYPISLGESYLENMYNRLDLPEQKNTMVFDTLIYTEKTIELTQLMYHGKSTWGMLTSFLPFDEESSWKGKERFLCTLSIYKRPSINHKTTNHTSGMSSGFVSQSAISSPWERGREHTCLANMNSLNIIHEKHVVNWHRNRAIAVAQTALFKHPEH